MISSNGQHKCSNCGNIFSENYCNRCGLKEVHRLTTRHVVHDLVHVFLHADKGIFPFMSRVVLQPGVMAREFVEGKRQIFNPFQFLIFCVGFTIFLMTQSNFYESLDSYNANNAKELPTHFKKGMSDFNWLVKNYANLITFATLPLYALFSRLMFRKRTENYAEHFTLIVFAMDQVYIINALFLMACILFNVEMFSVVTISMLLTIASFALAYTQFFRIKWYKGAWKSVLVYITSYITQVLIIAIALLVYVFILRAKSGT